MRLGINQVLKVVQQQQYAPVRESGQQGPHLGLGGGLGVLVERIQFLGNIVRQQLDQVGVQVGHRHAMRPTRAQVDDAIHTQRPIVVGQLLAF